MFKQQNRYLAAAALVSAVAIAQDSTVTSFFPVCPTASSTTITLATTVTFCPGPYCNGPMVTPPPNGVGQPGVHVGEYTSVGPDGQTTVLGIWETVYNSMCETGLIPATYTITAPCPCEETPHPSVLPAGFETTVMPCSVCEANGGPSTVTLTQPCPTGPYASQTPSVGQPQGPAGAAAAPAPAAVGWGAQASAGAGASASAGLGWASASSGAGSNAQAGSGGASANSGAGSNAQTGSGGASANSGAGSNAQAGSGGAPANSGAGSNAQTGSGGASANSGAGSNAQAGSGGASAGAGAGASASSGPGGSASANLGAGSGASTPGQGVVNVVPINGTTSRNGTAPMMSAPVPSPVQSYISGASKFSFIGFTLFAGLFTVLLF